MIDMINENANPFAEGDQARDDLEWALKEIADLKKQIMILMEGQILLLKDYNERVQTAHSDNKTHQVSLSSCPGVPLPESDS